LFLAKNGKLYVPGKLPDMASQYAKLAGLTAVERATYTATIMLDNGANLRHFQ
jgi:integrase/recombinase XerD